MGSHSGWRQVDVLSFPLMCHQELSWKETSSCLTKKSLCFSLKGQHSLLWGKVRFL